jgi:hypothetical protein
VAVLHFPFPKTIVALALLVALAGFAACGGGGGGAVPTAPVTGTGGGTAGPGPVEADVVRQRWTPYVIPDSRTEPVLYEVVASGSPESVTLSIDGTAYALHDDGRNGDLAAADGIWAVQLPASVVLAKNRPEWVNRPHIGALRLASQGAAFNVFAEVWTPSIGTAARYPVDAGQETDYVASYLATADQLTHLDPAFWARRFYATHPDQFDFLNIVMVDGARGNRYHSIVKNTVSGIGLGPVDLGASFGSAGKLIGYSVFPIPSFFDHGGVGFLHETAHQWINFLPMAPLAGGTPHWPKGNLAINVMGFSIPPSGQGGEYPFSFVSDGNGGYVTGAANPEDLTTFNMLELYMMGLASPGEVPDYFALKDQGMALQAGQALPASQVDPIRIADIVARAGVRLPDAAGSQKQFRSATIILSERPLDATALSFYDYFARRGEATTVLDCSGGLVSGMRCKPWYLATGGRSTMQTRIR